MDVLNVTAAAKYLGVSISLLNQWRSERYGPVPMLWGIPTTGRPLVRYLRADLDAFKRETRQTAHNDA